MIDLDAVRTRMAFVLGHDSSTTKLVYEVLDELAAARAELTLFKIAKTEAHLRLVTTTRALAVEEMAQLVDAEGEKWVPGVSEEEDRLNRNAEGACSNASNAIRARAFLPSTLVAIETTTLEKVTKFVVDARASMEWNEDIRDAKDAAEAALALLREARGFVCDLRKKK